MVRVNECYKKCAAIYYLSTHTGNESVTTLLNFATLNHWQELDIVVESSQLQYNDLSFIGQSTIFLGNSSSAHLGFSGCIAYISVGSVSRKLLRLTDASSAVDIGQCQYDPCSSSSQLSCVDEQSFCEIISDYQLRCLCRLGVVGDSCTIGLSCLQLFF